MALKEKYKGKVEFIIVDVDQRDAQTLAAEYQVDAIPNFKFIDGNGEVLASHTGEMPQIKFEDYIKQLLE